MTLPAQVLRWEPVTARSRLSRRFTARIKLTLKNIDTGVSRDTITNDNGYYSFSARQPRAYEGAAEKAGFKRGTQEIL